MTERPIIFTAHSVRAIREGRKTQTRRIVDLKNLRVKTLCRVAGLSFLAPGVVAKRDTLYHATLNQNGAVCALVNGEQLGLKPGEFDFRCPYALGETSLRDYGKKLKQWVIEPVGEQRLWIKETWAVPGTVARSDDPVREGMKVVYRADTVEEAYSWRSVRLMPRWASRLSLIVESVRLERLQDITMADVIAEGIECGEAGDPELNARAHFAAAWDEINGKRALWASNCWVWTIRFRKA